MNAKWKGPYLSVRYFIIIIIIVIWVKIWNCVPPPPLLNILIPQLWLGQPMHYLLCVRLKVIMSRSQRPRCLRYELLRPLEHFESWFRISLETWMSVCLFILVLCCRVCTWRPCDGLTPRPPFQGDLPTVNKIKKPEKMPEPNNGL
jgi:hypothetical protein